MKELKEKLEKLKAITSVQQNRGAEKFKREGASGDGTLEGVIDTIGDNTRKIQSKSVIPTITPQTVYPDEGFYLDKVDVAAIPIRYEANASGGETLIIGGDSNVG